MESPLTFFLEHIIKSTLKTYIKSDELILDSYSFFDTSLRLKNIDLKPQKQTILNKIPIELLSGIIYDMNIEGSIMNNTISIDINNINLTLFIPSLDDVLYSYKRNEKIKKNPFEEYSIQNNQINKFYKIFSKLIPLKIKISKITLNLFIKIEDILIHLILIIGEFNTNSKYVQNNNNNNSNNNNNNNENEKNTNCFSKFNINKLNLLINFIHINELKNIYEIIEENNNNIININTKFIERFCINIELMTNKYRFEKESNINSNYNEYKNFEKFDKNNFINIKIKENEFNFSDYLILNILIIIRKIKIKKLKKLKLLQLGKRKLLNLKERLFVSNKKIIKHKGYKYY